MDKKLKTLELECQLKRFDLERLEIKRREREEESQLRFRTAELIINILNSQPMLGLSQNESNKLKAKLFEAIDSIDFHPYRYQRNLLIEKNN